MTTCGRQDDWIVETCLQFNNSEMIDPLFRSENTAHCFPSLSCHMALWKLA